MPTLPGILLVSTPSSSLYAKNSYNSAIDGSISNVSTVRNSLKFLVLEHEFMMHQLSHLNCIKVNKTPYPVATTTCSESAMRAAQATLVITEGVAIGVLGNALTDAQNLARP